jgi:hypothetical protein
MRAFYRAQYRKIRAQWRAWIAGGNSSARKLLDTYFDAVFPVVSEKSGSSEEPEQAEGLSVSRTWAFNFVGVYAA